MYVVWYALKIIEYYKLEKMGRILIVPLKGSMTNLQNIVGVIKRNELIVT